MYAPIDQQRHLIEIAELDARIAGLRHKDKYLPEQESLDALREERREVAGGAARARIRATTSWAISWAPGRTARAWTTTRSCR